MPGGVEEGGGEEDRISLLQWQTDAVFFEVVAELWEAIGHEAFGEELRVRKKTGGARF